MRRNSRGLGRWVAVLMVLGLVAAACGDDDGGGDGGDSAGVPDEAVDHEALGLWDDGPCDEALDPLRVGLTTTFESPVISLEDSALALEASAEAFNARGGANGACIEVTACDDGANADQAVGCAREMADAGVHVTVNDQATAGQAEMLAVMTDAGIPRMAGNVTPDDWDDQGTFPMDASGTGVTFLQPQALIEGGVDEIALIRVDLSEAAALPGLMEDLYAGEASFPADIPVPAGTTDFSQFILAAQNAGASGATLALGEQEAIQVVRAGQQLGTDLTLGASLGSFSYGSIAELGDFAEQMIFLWSYPPAAVDLPVYAALRADLAASGEESLQPVNLKASPMRSWIGLYALLWMLRDSETTEFSAEGIRTLLEETESVPMLDIFGGEDWTPDTDHPGIFQRAGTNHWATYGWDPEAEAPDGLEDGNFVQTSDFTFDETLCDSPFGGPC